MIGLADPKLWNLWVFCRNGMAFPYCFLFIKKKKENTKIFVNGGSY